MRSARSRAKRVSYSELSSSRWSALRRRHAFLSNDPICSCFGQAVGFSHSYFNCPLLLLTNSRDQGFSGEKQQSNPRLFESTIRKAYDLLILLNDRLAPHSSFLFRV